MWISNVASSAASLRVFGAGCQPGAGVRGAVAACRAVDRVYAVLFALNAFGIKLGARAITALAALKLTPLFLLAGIGVFFVDWSQLSFAFGDVPSIAAWARRWCW